MILQSLLAALSALAISLGVIGSAALAGPESSVRATLSTLRPDLGALNAETGEARATAGATAGAEATTSSVAAPSERDDGWPASVQGKPTVTSASSAGY